MTGSRSHRTARLGSRVTIVAWPTTTIASIWVVVACRAPPWYSAARQSGGFGAREAATRGSGGLEDERRIRSLSASPKIEEAIGEQQPLCDEVIRREWGRVELGQCQNAVPAVRRAEAAGCGSVMLLLEPLGCQRDVLAKLSLTERAAQLLLVVTAHRSGSGISVELDELFPGWAEKRGYFGHADLPLNVGGEEVGWRSLSPRVHNTRMCPTVATICASGPGRSARASPPSERRDRRPGRRRRTAPERLRARSVGRGVLLAEHVSRNEARGRKSAKTGNRLTLGCRRSRVVARDELVSAAAFVTAAFAL